MTRYKVRLCTTYWDYEYVIVDAETAAKAEDIAHHDYFAENPELSWQPEDCPHDTDLEWSVEAMPDTATVLPFEKDKPNE